MGTGATCNFFYADCLQVDDVHWCVVCGHILVADEHGVVVHDDVPHPSTMNFGKETEQ